MNSIRQALLLTIIKIDRKTGRQKERRMKIPKDKNMKRQKSLKDSIAYQPILMI